MARRRKQPGKRPKPKSETTPADASAPDSDSTTADSTGKILPGMSEQQIRAAGLAIDVPFESGEPQPERLQYADLGKTWTPPEGWPPEPVVADAGGGVEEDTSS